MASDHTVFRIPDVNMARFQTACAKLSVKSTKNGGPDIVPYVFADSTARLADGRVHRLHHVVFPLGAPQVDGWTFMARIDHANETGNIIRMVPNVRGEVPAHFQTAPPACDHCRLARNRRDTFVLRCDETGYFRQVGSSCLREFFDHDPLRMARLAELLGYAAEAARGAEVFNVGDGLVDLRWIDVATYCQFVAAAIHAHGWVSGRAALDDPSKVATRTHASGWYEDYIWHIQKNPAYRSFLTVADRQLAADALDWAAALRDRMTPGADPAQRGDAAAIMSPPDITEPDNKALNDYEHNILVVAEAAVMEPRSCGLAASIVGSYLIHRTRAEAIRRQRPLGRSQADSRFIGQVDDKIVAMDVVVLSSAEVPGSYGMVTIYRMMNNDGDVLKWFASKSLNAPDGAKARLSGTIKSHEEYKGVKQTIVTRCKLVPRHDPAPAAPIATPRSRAKRVSTGPLGYATGASAPTPGARIIGRTD